MKTSHPRLLSLCTLLLAFSVSAGTASAASVEGIVMDAHTDQPAAGVEVWAPALERGVWTRSDGTFSLDVGELNELSLVTRHPELEPILELEHVRQRPGEFARLNFFDPRTEPGDQMRFGAPLHHRPENPLDPTGPVELPDFPVGNPLFATMPSTLPATIRVGRRDASTCAGKPILRVETVPLEEYVEGVLIPEIGVFRSVPGGTAVAGAVFEAFAIAARSYAVWFYLQNPDKEYHLDDTACNQRYTNDRNAWVRERVAATAGQVFVRRSNPSIIDKYEYAASCGRHGSRPYGQTAIVPDHTDTVACVGTWCGHNGCAAHEANPNVSPSTNKCLVRGICQWGAVERSMDGQSAAEIVAHYQPNLLVLGAPEPEEPEPEEPEPGEDTGGGTDTGSDVGDTGGDPLDAGFDNTGDEDTSLDDARGDDTGGGTDEGDTGNSEDSGSSDHGDDTQPRLDVVYGDEPPAPDSTSAPGDNGSNPGTGGTGNPETESGMGNDGLPPLLSLVPLNQEAARGCTQAPRSSSPWQVGLFVLMLGLLRTFWRSTTTSLKERS